MKKLLLIMILLALAAAWSYSQNEIKLNIYKSGNKTAEHDIKDIDSITFQKLGGAPTCKVTVEPLVLNSKSAGSSFYVTAEFSKKMNKDIIPQIKFSAGTTSLEIDPLNCMWVDDSTYFWTYNVKDINQSSIKPNITISSARDLNGNTQNPGNLNAGFTLDTEEPYTVRIDLPTALRICEDLTGTDYIIKLTFNESMKAVAIPTINYFPNLVKTEVFAPNPVIKPNPNNDKEWIITYKIVDSNFTLPKFTLSFEGAQDLVGNVMDSTPAGKTFSVDTENPKVSSIVASKTNINLNDVNSTITITVTFNEAMLASPPPQITFTPDISKALKLDKVEQMSGIGNRFLFTYKVIQLVSENFLDVDVSVKGAKDSCGNMQIDYKRADYMNILFKITKVIEDGFDTYNVGGPPPPPWERLAPNGKDNQVQSTYRCGDPNSLMLEGSKAETKVEKELQEFTGTPDEINIEFCMMAEALTDSAAIALVDRATMQNFATLIYGADGSVYLKSGSGAQSKVTFDAANNPYQAYKWGNFRLQYNKVSGDLKLYYESAFITSVSATVPSGSFNSLLLYSANGKAYFDSIFVWNQ
jgi:hypothetical protein